MKKTTSATVVAIALLLAGCGGGGGISHVIVPGPDTGPVPGSGSGQDPEVNTSIETSFSTTSRDHYPLDAEIFQDYTCYNDDGSICAGHGLETLSRMVKSESKIASQEDVIALLLEHIEWAFSEKPSFFHNSEGSRYEIDGRTFANRIHAGHDDRNSEIRLFSGNYNSEQEASVYRAVAHINAWLPWDKHVTIGADYPSGYTYDEAVNNPTKGTVPLYFDPNLEHAAGTAGSGINIATNLLASRNVSVIQHEMLHILGISGDKSCYEAIGVENCGGGPDRIYNFTYEHVPVAKFPESTMAYGSVYDDAQGLSQIDGETLQAIYTRLIKHSRFDPEVFLGVYDFTRSDLLTDLGPWDDTVIRYEGSFGSYSEFFNPKDLDQIGTDQNITKMSFGVDWRNGMARPWAHGMNTYLEYLGSKPVAGTATWNGELVGFTPNQEAVHGTSEIGLELTTMVGYADFTDMEHWQAGQIPGLPGTGSQWNDGDLSYSVKATGPNDAWLQSTGGDQGYISGRFVGSYHGALVGILEHPDLAGAFGAISE